MLPITSPYRLTVVCFYRHLYTKYIWITYNITYKGSLYFDIPGVLGPMDTQSSLTESSPDDDGPFLLHRPLNISFVSLPLFPAVKD
jgi:hypothetical protein